MAEFPVSQLLTKSDVGLGNADNTSDVNKPVSTAQATADTLVTTNIGGVYRGIPTRLWGLIVGGTVATTNLFYSNGITALAGTNSGVGAIQLDPADLPTIAGRTKRLRIRGYMITNTAVAPGVNFTFHLYPVATWGGASGANPTVATVGTTVMNATVNTPAVGGPSTVASAEVDYPAAGWYVLAVVNSGTTAANSQCQASASLEARYS